MSYRKKGLHAEPGSETEKSIDEMFKQLEKFFEDEFAKVYHWKCPECSFNKMLLKSMVNNTTGVITCPDCGNKSMRIK